MSEIYLKRTLHGFIPADDEAAREIRKHEPGMIVKCEITRPRALAQHRLYWVMCSLVAENHDQLQTRDQVHDAIKHLTGHTTEVVLKSTGEVFRIPKQTRFSAMGQSEWEQYFTRAKDAVVQHLLPGVTIHELQDEILRVCA